MLRGLNRERGQTIVLVTHDPEVGDACDRIVRMRDGRVVGNERRAAPVAPAVPFTIDRPVAAPMSA
jgi:ABC-type lipoprotein export system ATPase subunit